jgi:chemotaxis protein CheD
MKKVLLVGIGDFKVSDDKDIIIKTLALGSCVAVTLFGKNSLVTGMAHIALPSSSINIPKAKELPAYFADTGISVLLKEMKKLDPTGEFYAKIAGGASILDDKKIFNIGSRNVSIIKQILRTLRIPVMAENTEGKISRTVSVNIEAKMLLITHKNLYWEI